MLNSDSSINTASFDTAVLLMIFNRPETTRLVFESIRQQRPRHLFVAADGPRGEREADIEKCKAARDVIQVDWECELHELYHDENLGCGRGPAKAITWFFTHVEEGIIIEDDCILSEQGFRFYAEMLDKYRDNKVVGAITATNLLLKWKSGKSSYFFAGPVSPTMGCWAGWKRAWSFFDYEMKIANRPSVELDINKNLKNSTITKYWKDIFSRFKNSDRNDVWDYQWHFARCLYFPFTIVSAVNLVSNIGFNEQATHTRSKSEIAELPLMNLDFPIVHPRFRRDFLFDWIVFHKFYNPAKKTWVKKLAIKLARLIYC